ncbi:type I 3-dehydroquinate dehydratase [Thermodesulforhabdus norvegica]|uniref:3-dehydroquinate dehydratase n=1 Tax=Thermodesulforhabdus norvegica TaxID=39841 RepID=A0A1I4RLZ8_9BACT|nr:type I 3-dehydroquinate dehydratase [Thermodesulforhabdus norvegica]SFM53232.1 3-dehydroquinate dehydratase [Thermodesulforhabdus norvegica]
MGHHRFKLCGILEHVSFDVLGSYMRHPDVDLVECRLDLWETKVGRAGLYVLFDGLLEAQRWPVIIACRPRRDGGFFEGNDKERVSVLLRAVESGAEWVELGYDEPEEFFHLFSEKRARVIRTYRVQPDESIDTNLLKDRCREIAQKGADVLRIIGHVEHPADCCIFLKIIPEMQEELGKGVIAYGLGNKGRWSRIACLFLGSPWTYVHFSPIDMKERHKFDAHTARMILKYLHGETVPDDPLCTDPTVCGYRPPR